MSIEASINSIHHKITTVVTTTRNIISWHSSQEFQAGLEADIDKVSHRRPNILYDQVAERDWSSAGVFPPIFVIYIPDSINQIPTPKS